MYDIYLPISVAAVYSKIPIPIRLNLIKEGLIPTLVDSIPEGVAASELAAILHIPVSVLPKAAEEGYLKDYLLKASCFSIDFIGFKEYYGETRFEGLLKELAMLKSALHICRAVPVRRQTRYLTAFAMDNGISLWRVCLRGVSPRASRRGQGRSIEADPSSGGAEVSQAVDFKTHYKSQAGAFRFRHCGEPLC